jgi:hypothetical protein
MADIVAEASDLANRLAPQDADLVVRLIAVYADWRMAQKTASALAEVMLELRRDRAAARDEAERLQKVLDSRPAIDDALPQSYILWSNSIREMELSRITETRH